MSAPRQICLDDTDPSIGYEGAGWSAVQDTFAGSGNFGETYLGTLHGTLGPKARFSVPFDGSAVTVLGRNDPLNASGVFDPSYECFIDGVSIPIKDRFEPTENNWVFCEWKGVEGRPHVLSVEVTVAAERTFWLDQIRYIPSPTAEVANPTVLVPHGDPMFTLGPGWSSISGLVNITGTPGAEMTMEFVGTKLAWFGYIPREFPGKTASAEFTVDGGMPTTFNLRGHDGDSPSQYEEKFFETGDLSPGPHKVLVKYKGPENSTPLTLGHVYITNGNATVPSPTDPSIFDVSTTGVSTTGAVPPASSSGTESTNNPPPPIGAIVGGVVGGVLLIAIAIVAVYFMYRKRKSSARHDEPYGATLHDSGLPRNMEAAPFIIPQTHQSRPDDSYTYTPSHSPQTSMSQTAPPIASLHSPPLRKGELRPLPSQDVSSIAMGPPGAPPSSTGDSGVAYSSSQSMSGSSRVVLHSDSGMRLGPSGEVVQEIPPVYTPG